MKKKNPTTCELLFVMIAELVKFTIALLVMGFQAARYLLSALVGGIGNLAARLRAENEARRAEIAEAVEEWDEEEEGAPALLEEAADEAEEIPEEEEDDIFRAYLHGRTWEKALSDEERRLFALYNRLEKVRYLNEEDPESWKKYQRTKAYRGLMWDINEAEELVIKLEGYLGIVGGLTAGIMAARARDAA